MTCIVSRLMLPALVLAGCADDGVRSAPVVHGAVHHMEAGYALVGADLKASAVEYVIGRAADLDLGLSAGDDYQVFRQTTTPGLRHLRLQQLHQGVPVHGAEIVVHADDSTFLGFGGYLTASLDGFDVAPTLDETDALAIARNDLAGDAALVTSDEAARLVILPGRPNGASLAWHVTFATGPATPVGTGEWNLFVDARAGAVLKTFDASTTAVEQGSGPGGNAKKSRTWSEELDVEMDDGVYKMNTDKLETQDRSNDDDVFEAAALDGFTDTQGNDAHGYAEITLRMMAGWMGRDSLDDDGFKVVSRVHDTDYCRGAPRNACWKGQKMNYGDGGGRFLPFAHGLDVVAHELNHGFTDFHSDLEYSDQSGGLNESFSDIAGVVAEHFEDGESADFLIGEDIMVEDEPLRWMCTPTVDGLSIDHAGDYEDGLNPHYSSGVPNRAFCMAVGRHQARTGGSVVDSVREIGHIWYTANAAYWTSGTTYVEGCRGTVDAARALGHSGQAIVELAQSWADVGAECESTSYVCDDDGDCDAGEGENCASCPEDCGNCGEDCNLWDLLKCQELGDCSQCDDESTCGDNICSGDETDENCGQDCGCQALSCEQVAPFGCYCDDACEEFGDCCADRDDACD